MNEIQIDTRNNTKISPTTSTTLLATPNTPKSEAGTKYDSDNMDSIELARDTQANHNKRNKKQSSYNIENEHSPLVLVEKEKESKQENSSEYMTKPRVKNRVKLKEQHDVVSIKSHNRLNGRRTCSESESTMSTQPPSINPVLDYKYMVLLASFCAYMLAALLSSCFGVFFESMQADLGWSKGQCGFVGALLSALNDLAGPISSALTNRYGCRKTTIFGGLIAALGVIGSAFFSDFWILSFLLGGVSGFGSSLVLVASVVIVTYYFEDKPSLAAGLTISGASFGQSIFTMIIISLNEHYGRSGCFLILGGILLNIVVCGALFRPLQWELEESELDDSESSSSSDESSSDSEDSSDSELCPQTSHNKEASLLSLPYNMEPAREAPMASNERLTTREETTSMKSQAVDQIKSIIFNENNNLEISQSTTALVKALRTCSRPQLARGFNSDTCLNYNESPEYYEDQDMELDNDNQSLKSLSFFGIRSKKKQHLERHQSLHVIGSPALLRPDTDNMNFSKSARSLNLYKSLMNFARRNSKSSEECNIKREELENAGFFVVDADELVNCSGDWTNSQTGVFFPFITNEENFNDKLIKSMSKKSINSSMSNNDSCRSDNSQENMTNGDVTGSRTLSKDDNVSVNASQLDMKCDNFEIKFSQRQNNNMDNTLNQHNTSSNFFETSKTSSIFTKFSDFFATSKNTNKGTIKSPPSKKLNPNDISAVVSPTSQGNLVKPTAAFANKKVGSSSGKAGNNQHLFIKPVRTEQNGQRFIIARCTCQAVDKQIQSLNKKQQRSPNNLQLENSFDQLKQQQEPSTPSQFRSDSNSHLTVPTIKTPQFSAEQPNLQNSSQNQQQNKNQSEKSFSEYYHRPHHRSKSPKTWRHSHDCPVFYLNRLKNISRNIGTNNNHPAHHHHHNHQPHISHKFKRQNSLTYVPPVQVRFPAHFKNVYYYKSLINLNRWINPKSLGQANNSTINSSSNQSPLDPPVGTNQHHHNQYNQSSRLGKKKASNLNNLSLSCPDLNLNQVLLINATDKKLIPLNSVNKPLQNKLLQQKLIPASLNLKNSKVLNDGSILLNRSEAKARRGSIVKSKKQTLQEKTIANTIKNAGPIMLEKKSDLSLNTLGDYNDNIPEVVQVKTKHHHEPLISSSSSSSSSDDESSSSDEDSEDEDDRCSEFLKKSKAGTLFYKYVWKPTIQPLKYICYSILESIKLFKLFKFCVFAFCNFILSFFYEAPFYFINSYMVENSLSHSEAGTVNVSVGIVCIFASIAYGYFGDSKKVNSIILYSVSLILCGICCCLIPPFIKNYFITLILMSLIGALISVSDVLVPIICVNLVGYDNFVNAYGLMFFCQGLASLTGPPLLGMIVDYQGFALSYYIMGIGIILSGLILTMINCYSYIEKVKKTKSLDSSKEPLSLTV